MKYFDLVWGNVEIDDKDAIKIIKHPAMQRLKNIYISTYGYLFNLQRNSTRFEHCLGVYLLLKHYGASKEEQIAGLIHDVAHTAFSHLSTYALQGAYTGVEYHELMQKKFINESGLEDLLTKLGFDVSRLLNSENFSLLENNLPDICADRLDYALRDGLHLQILSRQQTDQILADIVVKNGEFVFKTKESAFAYSFNFYLLNLMFYGSSSEAHFNNNFGDLIKYAINTKVIPMSSWFSDDVAVVEKLKKSKNKKVKKWLDSYNHKLVTYEDSQNPTKVFPKKIRIVDPKVIDNKETKRLSEVDMVYKRIVEDYKQLHQKHELPVKIVYKD